MVRKYYNNLTTVTITWQQPPIENCRQGPMAVSKWKYHKRLSTFTMMCLWNTVPSISHNLMPIKIKFVSYKSHFNLKKIPIDKKSGFTFQKIYKKISATNKKQYNAFKIWLKLRHEYAQHTKGSFVHCRSMYHYNMKLHNVSVQNNAPTSFNYSKSSRDIAPLDITLQKSKNHMQTSLQHHKLLAQKVLVIWSDIHCLDLFSMKHFPQHHSQRYSCWNFSFNELSRRIAFLFQHFYIFEVKLDRDIGNNGQNAVSKTNWQMEKGNTICSSRIILYMAEFF